MRNKDEEKSLKAHVPFKSTELKDVDLVLDILLDCIVTGDIDTFREVLTAHLVTVKKAGVGRRTI